MNDTTSAKTTITIKKYANRRLYNTATSSYVTLDDLSAMVKEGIEFNVYDAKTSEDITRSVLTQIIVEEEGKSGQQNLLPINFLRQLIGFYGDNMQWMVPKYLDHSMEMLSKNQEQLKDYFQTTFGGIFPFPTTFEEMSKQNIAMFERAMRMFSNGTDENGNPCESSSDSCCSSSSSGSDSCCCGSKSDSSNNVTKLADRQSSCCSSGNTSSSTNMAADTSSSNASTTAPASSNSTSNNATDNNASSSSTNNDIPMSNVKAATSTPQSSPGADDMQQKIANLQRQLADLAKNRA